MTEKNIFISYADQDKHWAEWFGERLGKLGFGIWTDTNSVAPGASFMVELSRTIEKSDIVLTLLSPSYFRSAWCQRETAVAAVKKIPIIPVMVEPCEVRDFLQDYNRADMTTDPDAGFRAVVAAAEHHLRAHSHA